MSTDCRSNRTPVIPVFKWRYRGFIGALLYVRAHTPGPKSQVDSVLTIPVIFKILYGVLLTPAVMEVSQKFQAVNAS